MLKRLFDLIVSGIGLIAFSPILIIFIIIIWLQDFHSPFYIAQRVGKDFKLFKMVKLRSMVVSNIENTVVSTSSKDPRITSVGKLVRRYKLDEISQLWNVFKGEMSLVGPRPNVMPEVELYTTEERKLLSVKPGITDFSSIVFSDLNDILENSKNPNLDYNQLVRPWKSRLGLTYIKKQSFLLDIKLVFVTILSIFNRQLALKIVTGILKRQNVSEEIVKIASRKTQLSPVAPPGSDQIVTTR